MNKKRFELYEIILGDQLCDETKMYCICYYVFIYIGDCVGFLKHGTRLTGLKYGLLRIEHYLTKYSMADKEALSSSYN